MSDLTDEEIIATRKLHGLNDGLFKEGTGTNVGSINKIMERLKLLIIDLKTTKKVNEIITEKGSLNLAKDIETVLNLLKEKDKEIESIRYIKNSFDYVVQKESEKKDRQIDLMAEEIEKGDIEFTEYCEFKIVCDRNCKECIKRYYKSKAEKE